MQENLDLALKVRDICLKHKAEWKIRINGSVELEVYKNIERADEFYYKAEGVVRDEGELERLDYRLKYKKPPD